MDAIEVNISGAQKFLKSEGKKRNNEFSKHIGTILGNAERFLKNNCPVRCGFLKNAFWSKRISKYEGEVYSGVVYTRHANKYALDPSRGRFIEKTINYIKLCVFALSNNSPLPPVTGSPGRAKNSKECSRKKK